MSDAPVTLEGWASRIGSTPSTGRDGRVSRSKSRTSGCWRRRASLEAQARRQEGHSACLGSSRTKAICRSHSFGYKSLRRGRSPSIGPGSPPLRPLFLSVVVGPALQLGERGHGRAPRPSRAAAQARGAHADRRLARPSFRGSRPSLHELLSDVERRGEEVNWFDLPAERGRLMLDTADPAEIHGQGTQVISGSVARRKLGVGRDLFADDPLVFKQV